MSACIRPIMLGTTKQQATALPQLPDRGGVQGTESELRKGWQCRGRESAICEGAQRSKARGTPREPLFVLRDFPAAKTLQYRISKSKYAVSIMAVTLAMESTLRLLSLRGDPQTSRSS